MNKHKIIAGIVVVTFLAISCADNGTEKVAANDTEAPQTAQQLVQAGEAIFNKNCKMCHGINTAEATDMAPVLDSVKTHWPDKLALAKYIKNAKENLNTNDYTTALYEKWKDKPQMPPYLGLSDGEAAQLAEYLHYVSN
jgi:mono/diheme cytochrome c family protein